MHDLWMGRGGEEEGRQLNVLLLESISTSASASSSPSESLRMRAIQGHHVTWERNGEFIYGRGFKLQFKDGH